MRTTDDGRNARKVIFLQQKERERDDEREE